VRLTDVAAAAGVSIATASKALNNRSDVNEATRDRVQRIAGELGFAPNSLARGLAAGRTGTVGILTNDLVGRWALPILVGAEDAFGAGEISVILADARDDAVRERQSLRTLLQRRVDGLIVVGSGTEPRPSLGKDLGIPVVYAYAPSDDPSDMSVVTDNVDGAAIVIEHLVSMGRRRIATIGGEQTHAASSDREKGARTAIARHGLEIVNRSPFYGDWTERWGYEATLALLNTAQPIDAFMCHSDQIARGAVAAIAAQGLRVPDDIAVAGFDDWDVMVEGTIPPLTSVNMNISELGRRAAQRVFAALEGDPSPGIELMPCRLVVRASTGAARAAPPD
jgi:LacI family transcriptional regulator